MATPKEFEERYRTGDLPWDIGTHDKNLEEVIGDYSITPCAVLELGAGTGSDALWLVQKGFRVTAVDVSPTAVALAKERAAETGIELDIIQADILNDRLEAGPFGFVFDRGCFHSIEGSDNRGRVVETIWNLLNPGGYWFSIMGSTDGPDRDHGPPRMSLKDISTLVEKSFEILHVKSILMDTNLAQPPRGWACFMRRRDKTDLR